MSCLEKRRVRGDLIALCGFLRRRGEEGDTDLSGYPVMRHIGMCHGRFSKYFFTKKHCNSSLERWLMLPAYQRLRGIWTMP